MIGEEEFSDVASWPEPPTPAAFAGLAGEIVRAIQPHSEADPAAILIQLLIAFGNIAGRRAHAIADGARHYMNENALIVGPTGTGKGSGWNQTENILVAIDPPWKRQILSGLSSGEGLILAVRDGDEGNTTGERIMGAPDKRAFVLEEEFVNVLKVAKRESNTLSGNLRRVWDKGEMRTMTRKDPLVATNAHVSIVGHITGGELKATLEKGDIGNGLINRFLICASRRSGYLPDAGAPPYADIEYLSSRVRRCVQLAQRTDAMGRDDAATELWREHYQRLCDRPAGLLGSATSRARPHVLRLSLMYALLDEQQTVRRSHLESALAMWDYVERSTRFFFGDSIGDPIADAILVALRAEPKGMTRSEMMRYSNGHWKKEEVTAALGKIAADGLAGCEIRSTGGRPSERWTAVQYENKENKENKVSLNSLTSLNTFFSNADDDDIDTPSAPRSAKEEKKEQEAGSQVISLPESLPRSEFLGSLKDDADTRNSAENTAKPSVEPSEYAGVSLVPKRERVPGTCMVCGRTGLSGGAAICAASRHLTAA